ncbi:DUF2269 domain-containing protein [Corynebacterium liangguodongii]|uniref:DUF2269 domain-containing protein n=1 Tax=Corynebacterium liangguodongii TaxID=2079535 RepID=A0A2S0WDG5_9CORY|nr:DUF2269 domain-containing protein [Corynebacterium liangguodongii]AWB83809.1 DUF2269 domain-containing protein [Corynebacterium liangguodongii]PWB98930.1 DUF2269 domain-containing protein [Corynebacterium liangguodongii]
MTTVLVVFHVAAAILLLGPVIVATSMFPRQAAEARKGDAYAAGRASILYRITSTYGMLSAAVPLLGAVVLIFGWEEFKTNFFLHTAIVLALIAWGVLFGMVIPQQRKMMGAINALDPAEADQSDFTSNFEGTKAKATAGAGLFNLLVMIVLILMYLPSSIFA